MLWEYFISNSYIFLVYIIHVYTLIYCHCSMWTWCGTHHKPSFCRKIWQRDVTKFHVQLAGSMMLMLIVFVAGINHTEHRVGCITVGVLLHYLILVIWMWMGAEAILLFQKVVIVFKQTTTLYFVVISLVCWCEWCINFDYNYCSSYLNCAYYGLAQ